MTCTRPLKAYKAPGGGIVFNVKQGYWDRMLQLPCGGCISCRVANSRDKAIRCMHEAQMSAKSCMITLTYEDKFLPVGQSLNLEDWQLFAGRVRHWRLREERGLGLSDEMTTRSRAFRYMMVGEYGDENRRPHFHACVFGQDWAEDRVLWKVEDDRKTFTSKVLEEIWGMGFVTITPLNYQTANYVSRYVLKKITGKPKETAFERVDGDTGETWQVEPEFLKASLRPGLGKSWFEKYWRDVYPDDFVVGPNGKLFRPPKYYDKLLKKKDLGMWDLIRRKRMKFASDDPWNTTPERLWVRDELALLKAKDAKRKL